MGVEAIVARSLYIVSISEPAGATLTAVKHFIPHLFGAEYIQYKVTPSLPTITNSLWDNKT